MSASPARTLVRRPHPGREDERLTHLEVIAGAGRTRARPGRDWADPGLVEALRARGIAEPWQHQVDAAEAAAPRRARRAVDGHRLRQVAGLPAAGAQRGPGRPRPTRAGAARRRSTCPPPRRWPRTSSRRVRGLGLPGLAATTHDGDSSREQRDWARDHAEYVLTNPDMLHHSLLPGHAALVAVLRPRCATSSIDECHHYRGVFGAHVAQIVRRLRRVCASYGASPTFVLASATVAEPEVSASRLTGLDVPRGDRRRLGRAARCRWPCGSRRSRPTLGENGAPVRRSATAETADLLTDLVVDGVRTLAFVRSRRGAESVAMTARRLLGEVAPELGGPGGGLPRRLPARGPPRARAGAALGPADRAGRDQRARARHRRRPVSTRC